MSTSDPMSAELQQPIASAPMFDGLDTAHVDFLAAQSRAVFVPSGQVLFRKGTPSTGFYVVREGLMQLSVSNSEGLVKVVEILRPGSAFGHAVMFVREPYPVDATALADTHLVFVPAAAVDRVLDDDPAMARIMLASMARRLQSKIQDIAMLSLQSATQRIVAYILGAVGAGSYDLGGGAGAPADDASLGARSTSIELPALKQVLASRLGMTPETFSRAMRTLSDEGLIRADGAVIEIPDVGALDAYARSVSIL
jgi:CRP-like cAMP-binding protein